MSVSITLEKILDTEEKNLGLVLNTKCKKRVLNVEVRDSSDEGFWWWCYY